MTTTTKGRPRRQDRSSVGKRCSVYLKPATIERALRLGRGNLSKGIALAVTGYGAKK